MVVHYLFSSALCLEATLFPDVKASCWPDCTLSPNWHSGVWCGQPAAPVTFQWLTQVTKRSRSTEARVPQRAFSRLSGVLLSGRCLAEVSDALGSTNTRAVQHWRLIRLVITMTRPNHTFNLPANQDRAVTQSVAIECNVPLQYNAPHRRSRPRRA